MTTQEIFELMARTSQIDVSSPSLVQLVEFTRGGTMVRYVADGVWTASCRTTRETENGSTEQTITVSGRSFDELIAKLYVEWQTIGK